MAIPRKVTRPRGRPKKKLSERRERLAKLTIRFGAVERAAIERASYPAPASTWARTTLLEAAGALGSGSGG